MQQTYSYLFIFLFFLIDCQLFAQIDTLSLPEVKLTASANQIDSKSGKHTTFDSIVYLENRYAHIGELLSESTGIQTQNYGLGQSASVSIRGMGASHTQLYWQDVPLNSNMLGQVDFSLFPTTLFSDITLSYGASGSSLGSGGLGGSVMLNSDFSFDKKHHFTWKAGQEITSVGSSATLIDVHYYDEKKSGQTKLFGINSANKFSYVDHISAGTPMKRAKNAGFHQYHLMQSFAFRTNKIGTIRSHIWAMDTHRNLAFSKATQRDRALRAVSSLEHENYDFTLSYINEFLNYTDKNIGIDSDSYSQRVYTRGRVRHSIHLMDNESGFTLMWDKASAEGYPSGKREWQGSIFSHNKLTFNLLYLNISLREEWREGEFSPLLYTINIRPRLTLPFKLELTHSRNVHYPTFNDRYWQPGGNLDLQPEKAYHWEVSASNILMPDYRDEQNYFSIKTQLALYHTRLNNRIQWQPTNAGYWAAFNIKNVHSSGIEFAIPMRFVTNGRQFSWNNIYALTRTIDKTADTENYGNQIMYIPLHKWNSIFRMSKVEQGWSWTYRHGVTSRRFTSGDHSVSLPLYQTGSLSGSYDLNLNKKINMRFDLTVNNLWSYDYEVIQGHPMPLRYVEIGVSIGN